ncbi:hypothetical protein SK128_022377, partial [Halocaridina rubra]
TKAELRETEGAKLLTRTQSIEIERKDIAQRWEKHVFRTNRHSQAIDSRISHQGIPSEHSWIDRLGQPRGQSKCFPPRYRRKHVLQTTWLSMAVVLRVSHQGKLRKHKWIDRLGL